MSDARRTFWYRAGRSSKPLTALAALLAYGKPYARDNHYVSPPRAVRYSLERWSHEDERDNLQAGETWAPTYCVACVGMRGVYCVGEWYVDDSLSIDTFHVMCAPRYVRWLAVLGTLLCTIRAVLGVDKHHAAR